MTPREFMAAVDADPDLIGEGMMRDEDTCDVWLTVRAKVGPTSTMVNTRHLPDTTWDELRPILLGLREPTALHHITRVCGYFSRVENWNPSKVGELADRQAGQAGGAYSVANGGEA
jgi:hypothetical protein